MKTNSIENQSSFQQKSFLGILLFSLIGWAAAAYLYFSQHDSNKNEEREAGSNVSSSRSKSGQNSSSGKNIAKLLSTERSASLFARIEDIAATAKPGEVNQKLINACVETLSDSDDITRSRDFALLLEFLRPEDAAALHETFLKLHRDGRGYGVEYYYFAQKWGQVDGENCLNYLANEKPRRLNPTDYTNIVMGWSMKDPQAALKWIETHPDIANERSGTLPLFQGWFRKNPEEAMSYLLKHPQDPNMTIQAVNYAATNKLYSENKDSATDWIAALPTDDQVMKIAASNAWGRACVEYGELTYDDAARIWAKVGDKNWMGFNQFTRFTQDRKWSRINELSDASYLQALEKSWSNEKAAQQFQRWHEQQPEDVMNWLNQNANEPFAQKMKAAIEQGQGN